MPFPASVMVRHHGMDTIAMARSRHGTPGTRDEACRPCGELTGQRSLPTVLLDELNTNRICQLANHNDETGPKSMFDPRLHGRPHTAILSSPKSKQNPKSTAEDNAEGEHLP